MVEAPFSSSAEGRYGPDVIQRRPAEVRQLRRLHGSESRPNDFSALPVAKKVPRCSGNMAAAAVAAEHSPLPAKRDSKPAAQFGPSPVPRNWRQPHSMNRAGPGYRGRRGPPAAREHPVPGKSEST